MILIKKTIIKKTIILVLIFIYFFAVNNVNAQVFYPTPELEPYLYSGPSITSRAAVLIDAATGTILYYKNPNEEIPPASLAKLMTMHVAMKAIKEGRASYDELIPVTAESWARNQPWRSSLMFLEPGQTVTLREILLGLAVSSGNDAAVALALRFAPNMKSFADIMTDEARNMDLSVTRFTESSGISGLNMTTAAEFASFCRQYLLMHPNSLKDFHSVTTFAYPAAENVTQRNRNNPNTIVQENRNNLLRLFSGVDGLKTGFINESGYNIALTAERNNTRFILVLLGAPSGRGGSRIRDTDGINILSWAFDNFKTVRPQINHIEKAPVWKGKTNTVELKLEQSADFTSHISRADTLKFEVVILQPLIAPLPQGHFAGYIYISDEYGELSRAPLVTAAGVEKGNFFKRLWHSIRLLF
ncbi:MAG: D-alanyl-D-alanine carboxypeptidase [Treponema sp.]|nr:D-alanyl-D-alanine carboxypeptidase [Treponema sp.]